MRSRLFFSKDQQASIVRAIEAAELNTSGEIRVHVEPHCKGDACERAVYVFNKLGMYRTEQRNGVLVYLAYESHKFAIIGDKGINDSVPSDFWESVKSVMAGHFAKGDFVGGIVSGVTAAGDKLKHFFPYSQDDVNEQPDEISFG